MTNTKCPVRQWTIIWHSIEMWLSSETSGDDWRAHNLVSLWKPSRACCLWSFFGRLLFYCGGSDLQDARPHRVVLSLWGRPEHCSPPQVRPGLAARPSGIPAVQVGLPAAAEPPAACREGERRGMSKNNTTTTTKQNWKEPVRVKQ